MILDSGLRFWATLYVYRTAYTVDYIGVTRTVGVVGVCRCFDHRPQIHDYGCIQITVKKICKITVLKAELYIQGGPKKVSHYQIIKKSY